MQADVKRGVVKAWSTAGAGVDGSRFVRLMNRFAPGWVFSLGLLAILCIAVIAFFFINHVSFPLNLELMEGNILQHFERAAAGLAVYPEPSPEYVPLAYNPLYYYLAVPFGWVFGVTLPTLRLVAILGMIGSGVVLFRLVYIKTDSRWWALMAVGLFAAAYRVMDAYLDSAHSDPWLLFSALLGTYWIDRGQSRTWKMAGVLALVASFWFKQHGALFVAGGIFFLTWREGIKRAWPYWAAAALLVPALYFGAGKPLFGAYFHYFTWEVPRRWMEITIWAAVRYLGFIATSYPALALAAGWAAVRALRRPHQLSIWHFQLVMALASGLLGALDPGSSDNVFAPMGLWFIIMGTLALHELSQRDGWARRHYVHLFALTLTFAFFAYVPARYVVSPSAGTSYDEFVGELASLDGPVYAPHIGQLQAGYTLYPAVGWVALEDMIRGSGRSTTNRPTSRQLLAAVIQPEGAAYIVTNHPLEDDTLLDFLTEYYVLEADWGRRFKALRALPHRWDLAWPRYLYRYAPDETRRS
ncbi:MAG: hypothetical protein DWB42_16610 [Chloroflexi bacterium]|nr:hypothetical protein [Chloroflexota bacterium]MDL1885617.1 hypothetical protein [Anaerolineae bacterium CFX8]